jgi:hypothetical protein
VEDTSTNHGKPPKQTPSAVKYGSEAHRKGYSAINGASMPNKNWIRRNDLHAIEMFIAIHCGI